MHHSTVANLFIFGISNLTLNLETCFGQINGESTLKEKPERKLTKYLPNKRQQRTSYKEQQLLLYIIIYKSTPMGKKLFLPRLSFKWLTFYHLVSSKGLTEALPTSCVHIHYIFRQHSIAWLPAATLNRTLQSQSSTEFAHVFYQPLWRGHHWRKIL